MSSTSGRDRVGFMLIDLVVLTAMTSLLFAAVLAAAERANDNDKKVRCASTLKMIGQAILMYSNDNKGNYPRTLFDAQNPQTVNAFTGWKAKDPFGPGGPQSNDVTAAFYLLLRTQDIPADRFVCPEGKARPLVFRNPRVAAALTDDATTKQTPQTRPLEPVADNETEIANFPSIDSLGYSYCNPYPSQAAIDAGFKVNTTLPGAFAVAADINPGGEKLLKLKEDSPKEALKDANSPNHGGDGQNVLYGDGHVEWTATPFCGMSRPDTKVRDNIYTPHAVGDAAAAKAGRPADSDPVMGPSADPYDSVLLPTATFGEKKDPGRAASDPGSLNQTSR